VTNGRLRVSTVAQETENPAEARDGQSQVDGDQSDDFRKELIRNRAALMAAMARLEESLARPCGRDAEAWISEVAVSTDVVRDEVVRHIETHEGPGSFHEEVLASQPYLAPRVAKLQREHVTASTIVAELQAALAKARDSEDPSSAATEIRTLGSELLMLLVRHRQSGADLVWESVNLDLGSGE